jgi:predicted phage baseplate assembly protein
MSLPMPKLDDRTFDDLMAEARRRIPALCPEWTDLNPSDPGITVVELMAWMTEVLLYRVNRIPEKCFIALLELMGVKLRSAEPARTWLVFTVSEGASEDQLGTIPERARVATQPGLEEAVVFETCAPLNVTSARIVRMGARCGETVTDLSHLRERGARPTAFLAGGLAVPHHLYLGDARLKEALPNHLLHVDIAIAEPLEGPLGIEWERWNGAKWEPWLALEDATGGMRNSGAVTFEMPPAVYATRVDDRDSVWLRARLVGGRATRLPEVQRIARRFEVPATNGLVLDRIYLRSASQVFQDLNIGGDFEPFGPAPAPGAMLYLGSEAFANESARFVLLVSLAAAAAPPIQGGSDVEVAWEYRTADGTWQRFGIASDTGALEVQHGFEDHTHAFTQSGVISFERPPDMAQQMLLGESGWFIRAHLRSGSPESLARWLPKVETLRLAFSENPQPWEDVVTVNDSSRQDWTSHARDGSLFQPFVIDEDSEPAFHLAFDRKPANREQRIFFDIDSEEPESMAQIVWSYRGEDGWERLNVLGDTTRSLSARGAIGFVAPDDWQESDLLETTGYWLRAAWTIADFRRAPRLRAVHLNAVEAVQARSRQDEPLRRRDGGSGAIGGESWLGEREVFQGFAFSEAPLLAGAEVLVKELDNPTEAQVSALIEEVGRDRIDDQRDETSRGAVWVQWEEVENFLRSGPHSRHYMIDLIGGTVTFGDGSHGMIPRSGAVRARWYRTSEGSRGNVGVDTVTALQESYERIDKVTNVLPATGGADMETIEEAKQRGPWTLRHRHRAVTAKDFEWLAREASTDVALARCYGGSNLVRVVILPKSLGDRPYPSWQLVERVRQYLDARRLVTTRIHVEGPEYEGIEVQVLVVLAPTHLDEFADVQRLIENELRAFTHPLRGGPERVGWPIGRTLHISELYYILEQVEGVDYADRVMMRRQDTKPWVDKVPLGAKSYPYLSSIIVTQV